MNSNDNTDVVDSSKIHEFSTFCKILKTLNVSIRCVAEAPALIDKLSKMNGNGEKLKIIKFLPHESPLADRIPAAEVFNTKGYAVYYLPNEFRPGYEENYGALSLFRAFVVDLDGAPIAPVFDFEVSPSVIVETSEGKYQVVWVLDEPLGVVKTPGLGDGISIDEYNEVATELTALFDGDLNVCRATQPFRAPGFKHCKKEEFLSHIYWLNEERRCITFEGLKASLKRSHTTIRQRIESRKSNPGRAVFSGDGDEFRSSEECKIDLEALQLGEIKVGLGQRHSTLLRLASRLAYEGKSAEEIKELLPKYIEKSFEAASDFLGGRRSTEIDICIKDALKYAKKAAFEAQASVKEAVKEAAVAASDFSYTFDGGSLAINRYTETGLVERVLQRFSGDLARIDNRVFCFNQKLKLWKNQTSENYSEIKARAEACTRDMVGEEGFIRSLCLDAKGKLSLSKKHSAEAAFFKHTTINGVSKSVLNHIAVPRYSYSDFDADASMFYCANGVLNLRTGEFREARNEDRLLNRSGVEWLGAFSSSESCSCPGWLKFVSEVFAENDAPVQMCDFMQELFGYSLSGGIGEEKLFLHQGDGINGKSKMLSALRLICGEYATIVEPEELVTKRGMFQKSFERTGAKVEGKRCVIIDDFEVDSAWNEGFVKVLTGSLIRARGEYEKSRLIPNRGKFHIGLNIAPKPEAENLGILRRLCFIPYVRTFELSSEKGKEIERMIAAERSGILAWAVAGYQRMIGRGSGLIYPDETKTALEDYRKENFTLETIIGELFEKVGSEADGGTWETAPDLLNDISTRLREQGKSNVEVNAEKFGHAMKRFGALKVKKWNHAVSNTVAQYLVKLKFKRGSPADKLI